jgi:hypothetical protein
VSRITPIALHCPRDLRIRATPGHQRRRSRASPTQLRVDLGGSLVGVEVRCVDNEVVELSVIKNCGEHPDPGQVPAQTFGIAGVPRAQPFLRLAFPAAE